MAGSDTELNENCYFLTKLKSPFSSSSDNPDSTWSVLGKVRLI